MKIAVTSIGETAESPVDPRFGRARYFVVFDEESGTWEAVDNQANLDAAQGAGVQAAQTIAGTGATVLLTGHCGPRAHATLQAAGIAVYTGADGPVSDAVARYRDGKMEKADAPDVSGHHGTGG